jgi:hypothetical protein
MNLLKKIKDFFNQPDQMDYLEERFYKKLEDIKAHPEKYPHFKKSSDSSKIPPVSLF